MIVLYLSAGIKGRHGTLSWVSAIQAYGTESNIVSFWESPEIKFIPRFIFDGLTSLFHHLSHDLQHQATRRTFALPETVTNLEISHCGDCEVVCYRNSRCDRDRKVKYPKFQVK